MNEPTASRWPGILCVLVLAALPLLLLGECVFGGKQYVPFDLAQYPPVATTLSNQQIDALRQDSNYDATEAPVWFEPEWRLARDALLAGDYPHWNPFARAGQPMSAHGHLGYLDPLHWPMLLFDDPVDGLLCLTCILFALGGLLMFGLLRQLRLERLPALFGAVAFALSGTLTANGHWYMRMEPLVLLPGICWAALRIADADGGRRVLPMLAMALAVACTWLAGFPPFCVPVTLLAALCCVVLVLREWRRHGLGRAAGLGGWLLLGGALGLALAAPQVLQQLRYYPLSARPLDPSLATIGRHAFDPMGLLGYVLPDAFSHPGDATLPGGRSPLAWLLYSRSDWLTGAPQQPNYNFTEYTLFPGTLTLFLAVLAVLGRRLWWSLLVLAALVACLLLAIGPGWLHWVYTLPVFESVPPQRFVGPTCALVAMLAAIGFQRLRGAPSPWPLRVLAVLGILAGAYCLGESGQGTPPENAAADPWLQQMAAHYRPIAAEFDPQLQPQQVTPEVVAQFFRVGDRDLVEPSRRRLEGNLWRSGLALVLGGTFLLLLSLRRGGRPLSNDLALVVLAFTALELVDFGLPLNRGKERAIPLRDTPVHEFLRQQVEQHRDQGGFVVARARYEWAAPVGTLVPLGVRDLQFYTFPDAHSTAPFARLYGAGFLAKGLVPGALPDDARLALPWWDAVGLRFLLSPMQLDHGGSRVGPRLTSTELDREPMLREFFVYERPHPLPRAWVVPALRQVADDGAELDAALAADFAPREYALITAAEQADLGALPADAAASGRNVHFLFENLKRLTLQVDAGAPGYLVLADTWLPGWTATIDGVDAPLARGNVYMRVLALPAGACRVEFRYRTPGLLEGLVIAIAGLLGTALLLLLRARRARHRLPQAEAVMPPTGNAEPPPTEPPPPPPPVPPAPADATPA